AAILARGDHLHVGMPLGTVIQKLVEGQRVGLHFPVNHGHSGAPSAATGGATMPTFQCQGRSPCARRRHTTFSTSSYMPGLRCVPGTGPASKAMYARVSPYGCHAGWLAATGTPSRANEAQ